MESTNCFFTIVVRSWFVKLPFMESKMFMHNWDQCTIDRLSKHQ